MYKVASHIDTDWSLTNYLAMLDPPCKYIQIGDLVYGVKKCDLVREDAIAMSLITRTELGVRVTEEIKVSSFEPHFRSSDVTITITKIRSPKATLIVKEEEFKEYLAKVLNGHLISDGRQWLGNYDDIQFDFQTHCIHTNHSYLNEIVEIHSSTMKCEIDKKYALVKNIKVSDLGIGGLDQEIDYIFRRAFVSRIYNEDTIQKLGIEHVKGVILYGPPGTGKTLISRKLSEILNCKSLRIVNGPEILDKYVGESEKKIRDLFQEAESDKTRGLHVVIFDEIDSICRARSAGGSAGSMAQDNVVNQLLAKMDGVEKLDNILIIGMTNRIDLIDSALLRPGRFEVKVEISLPDAEGRKKIFEIHMQKMTQNNYVEDVDVVKLVDLTENFSGAEITGVIKNAVSYALNRNVENLEVKSESIMVKESDFLKAIQDTIPMFGKRALQVDGLVETDPETHRVTKNIFWISDPESEKIAYSTANKLDSKHIVVISNYDLIGLDSYRKAQQIRDMLDKGLISESATVIFVRVEEIIEYFPSNSHFNIQVAQTIKTILAKKYSKRIQFIISANEDSVREIMYPAPN